MKKQIVRTTALLAAFMFISITALKLNAHARAGGSRSSGSMGSRSYARPAGNYSQPSPSRPQVAPAASPFQQPAGGGFMRSMAGGVMGGMLGGMLFRSLGMAGGGMGGMGGGGMGIFEILLLAGIGYLIYRFIKNRREAVPASPYGQGNQGGYQDVTLPSSAYQSQIADPGASELEAGLAHIRQMDPGFEEARFSDTAMDLFFKIQGSWMGRDLAPVAGILTEEMKRVLQEDLDRLLREKQINRLENIAIRKVELAEVWQESGQDYVTALITANLLDYTTDDTTGALVSGSKTDPVKFEEYWTFTRPVGNNQWRLSAIQQK